MLKEEEEGVEEIEVNMRYKDEGPLTYGKADGVRTTQGLDQFVRLSASWNGENLVGF